MTMFNIKIENNKGESESVSIKNFIWKLGIKIDDGHEGRKILTFRADCTPEEDLRLWDHSLSAKINIHTTNGVKIPGITSDHGEVQATLGAEMWERCLCQSSHITVKMETEIEVKNQINPQFLTKQDDDDVEIVLNDQKLFANKFILAQYSEYFRENIDNTSIDISEMDIPYEYFAQFLDFINNMGSIVKEPKFDINIYKEINDAKYTTFCEMLKIAIKLKADHPREVCWKILTTLEVDTLNMLQLAADWDVEELKEHFFGFTTLAAITESFRNDGMYLLGEKAKAAYIDQIHELTTQNVQVIEEAEILLQPMGDKHPTQMTTIAGLPFMVTADENSTDPQSGRKITVKCNWQDFINPWKCQVKFTINGRSETRELQRFQSTTTLDHTVYYNYPTFVKISVIALIGYYEPTMVDFKALSKSADLVVKVGDQKYHVSRKMLCKYSNFFKAHIEPNPEESEIAISDVYASEFEELLNFMYYPYQPISDQNIRTLFNLSNRFDIAFIKTRCEAVLKKDNTISLAIRMIIAHKCEYPELLDFLIEPIQTFENLRKLEMSVGFEDVPPGVIKKITKNLLRQPYWEDAGRMDWNVRQRYALPRVDGQIEGPAHRAAMLQYYQIMHQLEQRNRFAGNAPEPVRQPDPEGADRLLFMERQIEAMNQMVQNQGEIAEQLRIRQLDQIQRQRNREEVLRQQEQQMLQLLGVALNPGAPRPPQLAQPAEQLQPEEIVQRALERVRYFADPPLPPRGLAQPVEQPQHPEVPRNRDLRAFVIEGLNGALQRQRLQHEMARNPAAPPPVQELALPVDPPRLPENQEIPGFPVVGRYQLEGVRQLMALEFGRHNPGQPPNHGAPQGLVQPDGPPQPQIPENRVYPLVQRLHDRQEIPDQQQQLLQQLLIQAMVVPRPPPPPPFLAEPPQNQGNNYFYQRLLQQPVQRLPDQVPGVELNPRAPAAYGLPRPAENRRYRAEDLRQLVAQGYGPQNPAPPQNHAVFQVLAPLAGFHPHAVRPEEPEVDQNPELHQQEPEPEENMEIERPEGAHSPNLDQFHQFNIDEFLMIEDD